MTNENKSSEEQDPELDTLLDDALDDFNKPTPPGVSNSPAALPPTGGVGSSAAGGQQVLTEEMIKQATRNFEASMRAIMMQEQYSQQQVPPAPGGSAPAAPHTDTAHFDVNALAAEFAKFAETASKVAGAAGSGAAADTTPAGGDAAAPDFQNILAETVKQMAQNTQEFQSAPSADELSQLLSGLGLAGGEGGEGEAAGLFPLMQSMLENILSKEILYPPIKEIVDKYPDWLADHRTSVEPEDFDRYSRQYDIMKKVVELFESENESDSDEVKAKRFEDLMMHMQKLQEEGHPPTELGGDVAGNLASLSLDASGSGAPDFGALLAGLPTGPAGPPSEDGVGEEQCCLM